MHTVVRTQQFPSPILPLSPTEFWERQFCSPCCASARPFRDLVFLTWPKVIVKFKTWPRLLNKNSNTCKENTSNSGVEYKQRLEVYHILSHRSSLVTCCRPLPVNIWSDFGFDLAVPFLGSYCSKPWNLLKHVKHLADMLCPSRVRKASQVVAWRVVTSWRPFEYFVQLGQSYSQWLNIRVMPSFQDVCREHAAFTTWAESSSVSCYFNHRDWS